MEKKSNIVDELAIYLKQNNCYDELYEVLQPNNIKLEDLHQLESKDEVDQYADEYKFDFRQKIKFRRLMKIIMSEKSQIGDKNEQKFSKEQNLEYDHEMTVVLIGDIDAGKTCLAKKYVYNEYNLQTPSTDIVDEMSRTQRLSDNTYMKIQIWYEPES